MRGGIDIRERRKRHPVPWTPAGVLAVVVGVAAIVSVLAGAFYVSGLAAEHALQKGAPVVKAWHPAEFVVGNRKCRPSPWLLERGETWATAGLLNGYLGMVQDCARRLVPEEFACGRARLRSGEKGFAAICEAER